MYIYVVETPQGKRMSGINTGKKRVSAKKATSFFADILKGIKSDPKSYVKELIINIDGVDVKYTLEERDNAPKSAEDL